MLKRVPPLCCPAWWGDCRKEIRPRLCTALIASGLALAFCHYLFLVTGYTGPDGLCEGLLWATNLSWNVRLGRWLMVWYIRRLLCHPAHLALLVAATMLLPLAFNVIDLIATDVRIDRLMSYPMQLLLPFCFAVWELPETGRLPRLRHGAAILLTASVCWLFAISATATYRTVELSYRYVGALTDSILNQILADPAYTAESKLLMAGFPDENRVQQSNALYWFSQYKRSPVFWDGTHGILDCWPTYLYDYHGIGTNGVTLEEYEQIVRSEAFAAMPVYPEEGSIAQFGETFVVKLQEDPPQ